MNTANLFGIFTLTFISLLLPHSAFAESFDDYKQKQKEEHDSYLGKKKDEAGETEISDDDTLDDAVDGVKDSTDTNPVVKWLKDNVTTGSGKTITEELDDAKSDSDSDGGATREVGISDEESDIQMKDLAPGPDAGLDNGQPMTKPPEIPGIGDKLKDVREKVDYITGPDGSGHGAAVIIKISDEERSNGTAMDYKAIYASSSPAVVYITSEKAGNKRSKGTGTIVLKNNLVITNAHVVEGTNGTIKVYLKPEKLKGGKKDLSQAYNARLIATNDDLDLALLEIVEAPGDITPLQLSSLENISIGEPTAAIGHPTGGAKWSLTTGQVSGVINDYDGTKGRHVFQSETSMNPGNSGGPLLDGNGEVIGINSFIKRQHNTGIALTGLNFSLQSTVVLSWIQEVAPDTVQVALQMNEAEEVNHGSVYYSTSKPGTTFSGKEMTRKRK